jgi:hypothetical protein
MLFDNLRKIVYFGFFDMTKFEDFPSGCPGARLNTTLTSRYFYLIFRNFEKIQKMFEKKQTIT